MTARTLTAVRPVRPDPAREPADRLPQPATTPAPDVIPAAPRPRAAPGPGPINGLGIGPGQALRWVFDRLIASGSTVSNDPVLDVRLFPWTQGLRANWRAIRDEAEALHRRPASTLGSGKTGISQSMVLWSHGDRNTGSADLCPATSALVERIPGLHSACFSTLGAGADIPEQRGQTKALVACHLGLIVPRDGDVRMRVHDRVVRWAEGETLVFDDTHRHAMWNESRGACVVLLIRFRRPLRRPGSWFARLFLRWLRRLDADVEVASNRRALARETKHFSYPA